MQHIPLLTYNDVVRRYRYLRGKSREDILEELHRAIDTKADDDVSFYISQFKGFTSDTAEKLINAGYQNTVVYHIENFDQSHHPEIAGLLIDKGYPRQYLTEPLGNFKLSQKQVIKELTAIGAIDSSVQNLEQINIKEIDWKSLQNLTIDVMLFLRHYGYERTVLENIGSFADTHHATIAHILINDVFADWFDEPTLEAFSLNPTDEERIRNRLKKIPYNIYYNTNE